MLKKYFYETLESAVQEKIFKDAEFNQIYQLNCLLYDHKSNIVGVRARNLTKDRTEDLEPKTLKNLYLLTKAEAEEEVAELRAKQSPSEQSSPSCTKPQDPAMKRLKDAWKYSKTIVNQGQPLVTRHKGSCEVIGGAYGNSPNSSKPKSMEQLLAEQGPID